MRGNNDGSHHRNTNYNTRVWPISRIYSNPHFGVSLVRTTAWHFVYVYRARSFLYIHVLFLGESERTLTHRIHQALLYLVVVGVGTYPTIYAGMGEYAALMVLSEEGRQLELYTQDVVAGEISPVVHWKGSRRPVDVTFFLFCRLRFCLFVYFVTALG